MLLSACILMKGDAEQLRRITKMVRPLADEIVVVCDDFSSDTLTAVAFECGARLVPHRWKNDFAAARNAGLEAAQGDWVFWIDCDETLLAPDALTFRRLLDRQDVLAYYVTIEDVAEAATSPRQHLSLYRRKEDIRYFGRIHEHFEPLMEEHARRRGMNVAHSPVRLRHTGYQIAERPLKLQRNIALLELELADRPGQLYYQIELGRSLLLAGQERGHVMLAEAARTLQPTLPNKTPPNPLAAALLEYAMAHAPQGFPLTRSLAAEAAARWFPSCPPLVWQAARWHYSEGRLSDSAKLLQSVLEMAKTKRYDSTLSFDQRIFGDETRLNLGVCYAKLGEFGKAVKQLKRIDSDSAFFAMAQANLKHLESL